MFYYKALQNRKFYTVNNLVLENKSFDIKSKTL